MRSPRYSRVPSPSRAVLASLLVAAIAVRTGLPEEAEVLENDACSTCHDSRDLSRKLADGTVRSLFVTQEELSGSVHARLRCVQCHQTVTELPHPEGAPIGPASCVPCHDESVARHEAGVHGGGGVHRDREPVPCSSCHGPPHRTVAASEPASPVFRSRIPETCGACHGDLQMVVTKLDPILRRPFKAYQESVHGRALANGSLTAAVCTDCHKGREDDDRGHAILPASRAESSIFRFNVPETCGTCHEEVLAEYSPSIHGTAVRLGVSRSPVCTDCHGIHTIKSSSDPESSVAARTIATTTCPQCHQSVTLTRELGLPAERLQTYLDSYHGLAFQRGSKVVANCASCHGVHAIYPSSDPRSMVHPSRLAHTCGECHPGATDAFTRGKIHGFSGEAAGIGAALIDWVAWMYVGLIVVTVGGMGLHNFLDLRKKTDPRNRWLPQAHLVEQRLDRHQRIQHAILASSFILLVLTGFALRFPGSWLSALFWDEPTRRLLHRLAAVVMVGLGVYHVVYLAAASGGRKAFRRMVPAIADAREAARTVLYNLGRVKERPHAGHFGYAEKLEYWAVIWGTAIMGLTGFLLWFKAIPTDQLGLPMWVVDLAHTIHLYEAWLATLAILIWHFYFVIFDPAVYPMNWGWWTGWVRKRPPGETEHAGTPDGERHG